ncbi:BatD family protein [Marinobacter salinexigens]|nr:BatD family protein [Marinobacter salinexigens]
MASHAEELRVEPDRTQLYEGEVVTLTVKGTMKLDINLSNLFDFNLSDLPNPDIEKVEPDFRILSRNQRYSIRTVNNDMVGEITWTYQLAPESTGKLTIPALTFRDATSEPVTIEVIDGTPPQQDPASARDSFIELAADKAEVYVQEQLTLTVRLFFSGNLIRGDLSEPEHPNAIIEPLGKQTEYSRYRDGIRYRVVERRYALFPQQPGTLTLPAIKFEGQARDTEGKLIFLRDSEQLYDVPVKDIPASFTGDTWLPASDLTLSESGLPPTMKVDTGENLTRELSLEAKGLPSEALPPIPDEVPEGLRSYPDQPERSTIKTQEGLTSTLSQTSALVPVKPGKMTLPEIRIPWWDTDTDSQQYAVLNAKILEVGGAAPAAAKPVAPAPESPEPTTSERQEPAPRTPQDSGEPVWQLLALAFGGLWLVTLVAWWAAHKRSSGEATTPVTKAGNQESQVFDELVDAIRTGSASSPALMLRWMNLAFPGHNFRTASEAISHTASPELQAAFADLQSHLFAAEGRIEGWDGKKLAVLLQHLRSGKSKGKARKETALPPLYPKNLTA